MSFTKNKNSIVEFAQKAKTLGDFRTDVSGIAKRICSETAHLAPRFLSRVIPMPYTVVDETLRVLDCNALLKKHRQVLQITRRADLELVHGKHTLMETRLKTLPLKATSRKEAETLGERAHGLRDCNDTAWIILSLEKMVEEGRAKEEEEEEECKETRNYLGKEDIESHAQWPRDIRAERFERDVKRMRLRTLSFAGGAPESLQVCKCIDVAKRSVVFTLKNYAERCLSPGADKRDGILENTIETELLSLDATREMEKKTINLGESRHHQERTSRNEKNFRCVILSTDTLCVNVARAKAKSRSKKRKTEKSREEERKKVNDVDAATTTFRFPENDDEQSNGFARAAISEVLETSFPHFRWISKVARPKKRMKLCSLRTWYNPLGRAMKY
ncbi:hypothetical protein V1477_016427 [Vespula maculifrons]|uniref:Uncharacterized protein n=1 Tax=Vespula maculifrons TaxID=7453 RepID=A0ABD2BD12_VESMC